MAGTLTISTLSDGTNSTSSTNCIQGSAKAWCNWDGYNSPYSIRASYNVSSVTRNSAGDYTLNFTNALADSKYVPVLCTTGIGTGNITQLMVVKGAQNAVSLMSATQLEVQVGSSTSGGAYDAAYLFAAVFR